MLNNCKLFTTTIYILFELQIHFIILSLCLLLLLNIGLVILLFVINFYYNL